MKATAERSPMYTLTRAASALLLICLASLAVAADYPAAGDFAAGAKQWAEVCGRCHNVRDARDLRDDQWITTAFHMRIRAGLTGEETRNILTFLQESNSVTMAAAASPASVTDADSATARTGAEIYGETCVACHGTDGKGALPGVPAFGSTGGPLSKSDEVLHDHILRGFQTPGSSMAMPPKGGNGGLTDADISSVLQFLRNTFGSK